MGKTKISSVELRDELNTLKDLCQVIAIFLTDQRVTINKSSYAARVMCDFVIPKLEEIEDKIQTICE